MMDRSSDLIEDFIEESLDCVCVTGQRGDLMLHFGSVEVKKTLRHSWEAVQNVWEIQIAKIK